MGNYDDLKQEIANVIKENGKQEITGPVMQNILKRIVTMLGINATFAGVAVPTTNPGTPDANVFYLASQNGVYTNFNNIEIADEVAILINKQGSWVKIATDIMKKTFIPIKVKGIEDNDLLITDDDGYVLAELNDGHIRTKNFDSKNIAGGFNPWKGKKMLCMGASSIGGQSKGTLYTRYYGYPLRTIEVLEMQLVNRMQAPRIYAAGGRCYNWRCITDASRIVYTDLVASDFGTLTTEEINYYHFQKTRGDRSLDYEFVSYSDNILSLRDKDDIVYDFQRVQANPLPGLFNLGASATIQEFIDSGRSDRSSESYENYLLDTSVDLLVISDQGIEVDAVGQIDEQIVPKIMRGTLSKPHYYYNDNVSLDARRNNNCGSILFLIDKYLSANPGGRVVYCQDGMLPTDVQGREEYAKLKPTGYKRFQWTAYMCAKLGIPFLAHSTKIQQTYLTKDVWIASDDKHPSDECFKVMGDMFAGELIAGTNDVSFLMYNFQFNE